jgi:hypothetical protein
MVFPLTEINPAEINWSASRLELIPEAAMNLFSRTRSSSDFLLPALPFDLPAGPLPLLSGPFDLPAGPFPFSAVPGPLRAPPLLTGDELENEFPPPDKRDPERFLPVELVRLPVPLLCCPGLLKSLILKEC